MTTAKETVFLGRREGKYELCEVLGRGGFAEVWRAYDPQLRRYVALKLLLEGIKQRPDFPDYAERFLREAQVMAGLRHANIVQLHDMGCDPGPGKVPLFLVLQYVEGPTFEDYLKRTSYQGKIPPAADIVNLVAALCEAVDYAHVHGVIHRDIKPRNILLDSRRWSPRMPMGEPMLTDFGLVKLEGLATLSEAGPTTMGTPMYLAPERAQGQPATRQSDVYSLGIVLFELCTGSYPYPIPKQAPDQPSGQYNVAVLQRHITCNPIPPRSLNPELPPAVAVVLLRALAKDPANRYSGAGSLAQALTEAFAPVPSLQAVIPKEHSPMANQEAWQPLSPQGEQNSKALLALPNLEQVYVSQRKEPGAGEGTGGRFLHTRVHGRIKAFPFLAHLALLIVVVVALVLGVLVTQSARTRNASPAQVVAGTVTFMSSGQGIQTSGQGIDDTVQVSLQNMAVPSPGTSYYAWLRSDQNQSDVQNLLLGTLDVQRGMGHLTYPGDQAHDNLLRTYSRFLLTVEDTVPLPSVPTLDTHAWLYTGTIPQIPDPHDSQHFSYLDHLRHLLAWDPALSQLGLPGGLSTWLFHNMTELDGFTSDMIPTWHKQNVVHLRRQLIRAMDYLDGYNAVSGDVPPNTPFLVNPTFAHIGILQNPQQSSSVLGYLVHIGSHLTGLINSPGGTQSVHEQATQIIGTINTMQASLLRTHADIRALLAQNDQQLLQPMALTLLSDAVSSITTAYGSPGVGGAYAQTAHGVFFVREHLQLLAMIVVSVVGSAS